MRLTFQEKYDAIGKRGTLYEGIFITAVKSTKIFCRPSCRARKPLAKNVCFYLDAQEAIRHGYRPCKICRPMEPAGKTPRYIQKLIRRIHQAPDEKIQDRDLRRMALEPNRVRRWFKAHHDMTFHGYQRLIRLNSGYHQIQRGGTVTSAAFDSGFQSLSGFHQRYRDIYGKKPTDTTARTVIYLERFATRLGPMFAAATTSGLCLLEFTDRRMLEREFIDLKKRLKAVIVPGTNEHIRLAKKEVRLYLSGKLRRFGVRLSAPGSEFQQKVWKMLRTIPYGSTRSYLEQAKAIDCPKAVRAVARANGMNRIAIIIPCHRVIGSKGQLTGYAGGLPRKKWLLEMEQTNH